jgi:TonB family protein
VAGRAVDRVTRLAVRDVAVQVISDRDSVVALGRTDTAGEFYADLPSPGTFRVRFVVDSMHTFDSAPVTVAAGEFGQHLFVIDIRQIYFEFQVEKQVRMAEHNTPPRYPEELRRQNIEGEVLAQFVVDTMGVAELQTFRPLRFTNPLFVQAVREALPRIRYLPAELSGHKVKQLVQQPFTFGLSGGPGGPPANPLDWPTKRGALDPPSRPWP